jgi:NhaP-type Na+/H+ or K+/H+ antiporter
LLLMAFTAARIKRLPLSTAMIYLGAGLLLGPTVLDQFHVNPLERSAFLEVVTEVAVLISLFAAGLKLAPPVGDRLWWVPFRLATVSMVTTVGLVALIGIALLDLPLGAAVLLGAVLAPTDPVLATDIQIKTLEDNDRLRFALTGEAGLNDGTAFPMVMLGLGLMGLHEVGDGFLRWWLVDVIWATLSAFTIGGVLGIVAGRATYRLAKRGLHTEYMEDWLGLGLIALAYGLTLLLHGYGFLAVFAAGFMFHRTEMRLSAVGKSAADDPVCVTPVTLEFVEQLERLGEVVLLVLIGGMLFADSWQAEYVLVGILLFVVVRPVSVFAGLLGCREPLVRKSIIAWFGVRGIGSLYYLMYAVQHGLAEETAVQLVSVVLVVVALSVVVHGITVKPLMRLYGRRAEGSE